MVTLRDTSIMARSIWIVVLVVAIIPPVATEASTNDSNADVVTSRILTSCKEWLPDDSRAAVNAVVLDTIASMSNVEEWNDAELQRVQDSVTQLLSQLKEHSQKFDNASIASRSRAFIADRKNALKKVTNAVIANSANVAAQEHLINIRAELLKAEVKRELMSHEIVVVDPQVCGGLNGNAENDLAALCLIIDTQCDNVGRRGKDILGSVYFIGELSTHKELTKLDTDKCAKILAGALDVNGTYTIVNKLQLLAIGTGIARLACSEVQQLRVQIAPESGEIINKVNAIKRNEGAIHVVSIADGKERALSYEELAKDIGDHVSATQPQSVEPNVNRWINKVLAGCQFKSFVDDELSIKVLDEWKEQIISLREFGGDKDNALEVMHHDPDALAMLGYCRDIRDMERSNGDPDAIRKEYQEARNTISVWANKAARELGPQEKNAILSQRRVAALCELLLYEWQLETKVHVSDQRYAVASRMLQAARVKYTSVCEAKNRDAAIKSSDASQFEKTVMEYLSRSDAKNPVLNMSADAKTEQQLWEEFREYSKTEERELAQLHKKILDQL